MEIWGVWMFHLILMSCDYDGLEILFLLLYLLIASEHEMFYFEMQEISCKFYS